MERLFPWPGNCRRLVVRYEHELENSQALVKMGCIIIPLRRHLLNELQSAAALFPGLLPGFWRDKHTQSQEINHHFPQVAGLNIPRPADAAKAGQPYDQ